MNSTRREPLGRTIILKKMERSDTSTLGTLFLGRIELE
jgi:hypothetical protein